MSKPTTVKEAIKNFETDKNVKATDEENVRAPSRPLTHSPLSSQLAQPWANWKILFCRARARVGELTRRGHEGSALAQTLRANSASPVTGTGRAHQQYSA